jgi:hypothetical protein
MTTGLTAGTIRYRRRDRFFAVVEAGVGNA